MHGLHNSAVIILVSVLLTAVLIGSFTQWYSEYGFLQTSFNFRIFVFSLVLSVAWNSLVRAAREIWPR